MHGLVHPLLSNCAFRRHVPAIGLPREELVQVYRSHMHMLKWHRDHMHKPGHDITILFRLGRRRGLSTRPHDGATIGEPRTISMEHGDLLVFGKDFNAWYEHAVQHGEVDEGAQGVSYGWAVWCSLKEGATEEDLYEQLTEAGAVRA